MIGTGVDNFEVCAIYLGWLTPLHNFLHEIWSLNQWRFFAQLVFFMDWMHYLGTLLTCVHNFFILREYLNNIPWLTLRQMVKKYSFRYVCDG